MSSDTKFNEANEANKVIAEYMGLKWDVFPENEIGIVTSTNGPQSTYSMNLFTTSIDSLVPVWEKLRLNPTYTIQLMKSCDVCYVSVNRDVYYEDDGRETIQEAAAIATAKAIQENYYEKK